MLPQNAWGLALHNTSELISWHPRNAQAIGDQGAAFPQIFSAQKASERGLTVAFVTITPDHQDSTTPLQKVTHGETSRTRTTGGVAMLYQTVALEREPAVQKSLKGEAPTVLQPIIRENGNKMQIFLSIKHDLRNSAEIEVIEDTSLGNTLKPILWCSGSV